MRKSLYTVLAGLAMLLAIGCSSSDDENNGGGDDNNNSASCPEEAPEAGGSCSSSDLSCEYDIETDCGPGTMSCECVDGSWSCTESGAGCAPVNDVEDDTTENDSTMEDSSSSGDTSSSDASSLPAGCQKYTDNSNVNYVGSPDECTRAMYDCEDGEKNFSNECGCGCVSGCPDSSQSGVDYTSENPAVCATSSWTCDDDQEGFNNACGCGCKPTSN